MKCKHITNMFTFQINKPLASVNVKRRNIKKILFIKDLMHKINIIHFIDSTCGYID